MEPDATTQNLPKVILFVEHDLVVKDIVTDCLRQEFPAARTVHVKSLRGALKVLENRSQPIDIILLEVGLPDARELEAVDAIMRHMRGQLPPPVVTITARPPSTTLRIFHNGATALVEKDVDKVREPLRSAINDELDKYQYRLELLRQEQGIQ